MELRRNYALAFDFDDNFSIGGRTSSTSSRNNGVNIANLYEVNSLSVKDYESLTPSEFQQHINNHDLYFRKAAQKRSSFLSAEEQIKIIHFRRFFRAAGINRRRFLRIVRRLRRLELCETYDEDGIPGGRRNVR